MADETNAVILPYQYYPDRTIGRPLFNGYVYIGDPDTDPEEPLNQKQVTAYQEDGGQIPVVQPLRTGAGGVIEINGSPVHLQVDGEYSIKVLNSNGAQAYYASDLVGGMRPSIVVRTQAIPVSFDVTNRVLNNTLFQTNIEFATYYNQNTPTLDYGALGSAPFDIENIPLNRMDCAQNNSTEDFGGLT